eukprot:3936626-Rhodomonas_salina.2
MLGSVWNEGTMQGTLISALRGKRTLNSGPTANKYLSISTCVPGTPLRRSSCNHRKIESNSASSSQ